MPTMDEKTQHVKELLSKFYMGDDFATQSLYNLVCNSGDYNNIVRKILKSNSDDKSIALLGYIYTFLSEYREAKSLLEKAYSLGNLNALSSLGNMYKFGRGVEQNLDITKSMFEKALDSNCPHVHYDLGMLYLHGQGVDKDEHKALELLKEGCKRGCASAYDAMLRLYLTARIDKSVLDKLDGGKHAMVYEKLARGYENGYNFEKDDNKAIELYEKAYSIDKYSTGLKSIYDIYQRNGDYQKMLETYNRAKAGGGYNWSYPMTDYFAKLYEENQEIRKLLMAGIATGKCDVVFANIMDKI
jgi:TPR repeat protein